MTPVQSKLLSYIDTFVKTHGFSPSYMEMAGHLGVASKSGIYRLVVALEAHGKIRRLADRGRSIEVVAPRAMLSSDIAERAVQALAEAHGFDDGDGMMMVGSRDEFLATLRRALGG